MLDKQKEKIKINNLKSSRYLLMAAIGIMLFLMAILPPVVRMAAIFQGIALAVGYGLYVTVAVKGAAIKASDYGWNWMAWGILLATNVGLPRFFIHLDADSFLLTRQSNSGQVVLDLR